MLDPTQPKSPSYPAICFVCRAHLGAVSSSYVSFLTNHSASSLDTDDPSHHISPSCPNSLRQIPTTKGTRYFTYQATLSMRHTLRRSCSACARSKHSCDLLTPRCSRCIKRNVQCVYANEPLTALVAPTNGVLHHGTIVPHSYALTGFYRFASVDPFESYPPTRLPRDHVQRLIHSCAYLRRASPLSQISESKQVKLTLKQSCTKSPSSTIR
jgi:hypothetical protein